MRVRICTTTPFCSMLEFPPTAALLDAARADADARKLLLRMYRWEVVRPALLQYDRASYLRAASCVIPAFGVPFSHCQPLPARTDSELLCADWGINSWRLYRLWALCRVTGKWPLPVLGQTEMPLLLHKCAACGQVDVDVAHPLLSCHGTQALHANLCRHVGEFCREARVSFLTFLFGSNTQAGTRVHHIFYVGKALLAAIGSSSLISDDSNEHLLERLALHADAEQHDREQDVVEFGDVDCE